MYKDFPYKLLNSDELIRQFNDYCVEQLRFLFIIDYKAKSGYLIPESELDENFIKCSFCEKEQKQDPSIVSEWQPEPLQFEEYKIKFDKVVAHIHFGNSFLVNLTQPTYVKTNLTIKDLYNTGTAKYKLWLKDKFTVLSPEIFVRIQNGEISSYPMKGTINANISDAAEKILNDPKEKAEHATIVDLIRNDLSMVAENVIVKRYRYIDELVTNNGNLLQVSSEIEGKLPPGYNNKLGDLLFSMLPAGSISGAPKPKTLQIIEETEGYYRGFYTGVFGWCDGENLDSAVMIRFAEPAPNGLMFKSGGGITSQSDAKSEYEELIQKIYVPFR